MRFRDLQAQYARHKDAIDTAIQTVLDHTEFINGHEVAAFEKHMAQVVGVKHCVTCANGTEAMTLVMMAWGIGAGDAVFVPDYTFFASGEIVSYAGATPVFVDIDPVTFNLDPDRLEEAILKVKAEGKLKPKVVIAVDLFGLVADYSRIEPIAERHGLRVLEDGAQGFGSTYNGKKACSFGDIATTSFFPAKPLGCYGDGGAIFTNDSATAELINSFRVHGKGADKYDNVRIGLNSRLDTLQAAILDVKLNALIDHELDDVNAVARRYDAALKDHVVIPFIAPGYTSSYAQYTIQLNSRTERDAIIAHLKANDIPTMVYFPKPMHRQLAFRELAFDDRDFPVALRMSETVVSLPMGPYLTVADQDRVVAHVLEALRSVRQG
jgi:UDP-2-acetamido-2-deoxy-ribo-hexuluronate aminotransferase